jgi:probable selenium-dependent hydroxylase accessory protein YqeC
MVALVGAGGKKTSLYRIAREHPGRVAISTTVHIPPFDCDIVEAAAPRVVAFAGPVDKTNRHAGLAPERIESLYAGGQFDLCLIKADGARSRLIKAPAAHEPVLPAGLDALLVYASIRAVGRRLDGDVAHRPDRVAELLGIQPGATLSAVHVGQLLARAYGSIRANAHHRSIAVINMVDDSGLQQQGRAAAQAVFDNTAGFDSVVLAAMAGPGIVEVIEPQ